MAPEKAADLLLVAKVHGNGLTLVCLEGSREGEDLSLSEDRETKGHVLGLITVSVLEDPET